MLRVDVDVFDGWLVIHLLIVIHLELLLVLLHTHFDAVHEDLLVVDLLDGQSDHALLVAEAADILALRRGGCYGSRVSRHKRLSTGVDLGGLRLSLNIGRGNRLPLLDDLAIDLSGSSRGLSRSNLLLDLFTLVRLLSKDLSLHGGAGIRDVMNELASHTVRAVAVGAVLLAELGLVQRRHIGLDHHVSLAMGEGAL